MPGKIFLKYDYYHGGLGDFVRGALATYAFCKSRNLEFHIYIPSHPLRHCFDLPVVQPETSTEIDYDIGNTRGAELLNHIYDSNPSEEIILLTNAYEFVRYADLLNIVSEFRMRLRPSVPVAERIAALAPPVKTYVSLHVRCGDAFMSAFDRYCPGDARCDPAAALKDVEAAVSAIRRETDLPILFHTDSEALRIAVKERAEPALHAAGTLSQSVRHLPVRPLEGRIQHTAQHSERNQDSEYYDSVAEFYIIAGAAHVYYTVPSGFPRWAAVMGNVPITHLKAPLSNA